MVGVLALQGDFAMHKRILDKIGVKTLFVKNEFDLYQTRALIIPGGESTTLSILLDRFNLRKPLLKYSQKNSIFGTCAGMIMLSTSKGIVDKVKTLNIMNFSVSRNSWGSQVFSFEREINLKNFNIPSFNSIFIRAPKVKSVGSDILKKDSLSFINPSSKKNESIDEVVILEDSKHLACSFHPEIGQDTRVHDYFLNKHYYEK